MAASSSTTSVKKTKMVAKKTTEENKIVDETGGGNTTNNSLLAQTYQKKTDKQHVLDAPDTYTGSMDLTDYETYIFNDELGTIIPKQIQIIPGLYKLFDEGVVNCRDHCVRMAQAIAASSSGGEGASKPPKHIPVSTIDISIAANGTITMINDGNGIDIEKHPEYDIWIPELIFGHLRTSTNYDKTQKKIVGGKNGFGFKLVLIWSTWGRIETVDHVRGLKYIQEFADNLNTIKPPTISKCTTAKPYTKVSFIPDYARLKLSAGLSPDMLSLFKRRVYDIAAITDKNIKVKYNGEMIPVKHFQQYVDLYIGAKTTTARLYEEANERWEYVVCLAPKEEFTHVSFVNGIYTGKGGKHIDYIINQIVRKLSAFIKQKKKVDVKPATIKEQLMLFVRCDIENPSFDSQTKDYMNTPITSFGSTCEVSDKFIEKIAKMGVMDAACALTEVKENKAAKKTDGTKSKTIRGIPKLIDANWAGTEKSDQTLIIFCEGDSAKAGIVSGLSTADRNTVGVYPMRGKMFNVRGEQKKRIFENKEVNEIKQILGLETGKTYTLESAKKSLRYGKVVFMTDQDLDGSHIKGLCINLFDSEWETLLDIPGFLGFMNTPIIKARKGTTGGGSKEEELAFYNEGEYNLWKQSTLETDLKKWTIKYYKGLGTSTAKEFKEYFAQKKLVEFTSSGQNSKDAIDMAFNKKRAQDRKDWLIAYDRNVYLDTNRNTVKYEDFIKEELVHFSKYDCDRSIPNMVDGFKTSLRKIAYTCFKRNLTKSIKVAQLSGSVSEMSCYHHGEQSLNGAIVGMAQNFVGANNINILVPNGQFGTRLQGGEDSASERYIFTHLNPLARLIFPDADDMILTYLNDDGTLVEPVHYAPIIPMLLVNGSKGIGTGFSSEFLCYNPLAIIDAVQSILQNPLPTPAIKLEPYYAGFKGTISEISENKYLFKGTYEVLAGGKQVRVTELPIGTWTDDYKAYIEDLITKGDQIKDYTDMSTDTKVDITVTFISSDVLKDLLKSTGAAAGTDQPDCGNGLEKLLKLSTTKSTTNMHAFDENEKLVKFANVDEVLRRFVNVRLRFYVLRKAYKIKELEKITLKLSNIARFITEILEDKIELRRKKSDEVATLLKDRGYSTANLSESCPEGSYNYLVKLPMDSVTIENVEKIIKDKDEKLSELELLKATSEEQLWMTELGILREKYIVFANAAASTEMNDSLVKSVVKKVVKKKIQVVA
jgi:DNA topoisomerase-2